MRCYFLITLALLASTALGAALAACSPSPRVSPSPTPSPLPQLASRSAPYYVVGDMTTAGD